jgi:hypothetical protein
VTGLGSAAALRAASAIQAIPTSARPIEQTIPKVLPEPGARDITSR